MRFSAFNKKPVAAAETTPPASPADTHRASREAALRQEVAEHKPSPEAAVRQEAAEHRPSREAVALSKQAPFRSRPQRR